LTGAFFWAASALALIGLAVYLLRRNYTAGICLAGILCPILSYLIFNLKLEPRYTLVIMPFFTMAFVAGVVCVAEAVGRLAAQSSTRGFVSGFLRGATFCALTALFWVSMLPLYQGDFLHGAPALACSFNDYKSVAKYLGEHVEKDDVVQYRNGIYFPVSHYLSRYVFPRQQPSSPPSNKLSVWFLAIQSGMGDLEWMLPEYSFTQESAFFNCYLWRARLVAPDLKRAPLPPLRLDTKMLPPEQLRPWTLEGMSTQIVLNAYSNAANSSEEILEVDGPRRSSYWAAVSPAQPCQPKRLTVLNAEIRGGTDRQSVGIFLRFYDEKKALVEEWPMRVPSAGQPENSPDWQRFRLGILAPIGARTVSAGIWISQRPGPGALVAFRNVELWLDQPGNSGAGV
jgi:hypothetical protein